MVMILYLVGLLGFCHAVLRKNLNEFLAVISTALVAEYLLSSFAGLQCNQESYKNMLATTFLPIPSLAKHSKCCISLEHVLFWIPCA